MRRPFEEKHVNITAERSSCVLFARVWRRGGVGRGEGKGDVARVRCDRSLSEAAGTVLCHFKCPEAPVQN